MTSDWVAQTDGFVAFEERAVLKGPGQASHGEMKEIVHERYERFDSKRRAAAAEAADREAAEELARTENQARLRPKADRPRGRWEKSTS
ncbi:MAG TPA: hypothetical protein VFY92_11500 [Hyphomicrobiaceae bacterium]|nr:hypothetical protein [Hyphomicrobiaceae bacterium]